MWLKCSYSNHSPGLIAGYYLESVAQVGGCPAKVRTDCGTENVLLASIQTIIVGQGAHAYGTSPSNQRIESWWSFFRRNHSQAYIDIFENLLATGAFQAGHVRQTNACATALCHWFRAILTPFVCSGTRTGFGQLEEHGVPQGFQTSCTFCRLQVLGTACIDAVQLCRQTYRTALSSHAHVKMRRCRLSLTTGVHSAGGRYLRHCRMPLYCTPDWCRLYEAAMIQYAGLMVHDKPHFSTWHWVAYSGGLKQVASSTFSVPLCYCWLQ